MPPKYLYYFAIQRYTQIMKLSAIKKITGIITADVVCNELNINVIKTGMLMAEKFITLEAFALSLLCFIDNEAAVAPIIGLPTQNIPIGIRSVYNEI